MLIQIVCYMLTYGEYETFAFAFNFEFQFVLEFNSKLNFLHELYLEFMQVRRWLTAWFSAEITVKVLKGQVDHWLALKTRYIRKLTETVIGYTHLQRRWSKLRRLFFVLATCSCSVWYMQEQEGMACGAKATWLWSWAQWPSWLWCGGKLSR